MAAAGKMAMTRPVARPMPPPSTPPTRVGVSCFFDDLHLAVGTSLHDCGVVGVDQSEVGVQILDRLVVVDCVVLVDA